jgi:hypothetical protein
VGAETFDRAFVEYTRRWAYKHPTPGDFFRTVENVSGMELGWYWRGFFYTSDVLDLGIDSVSTRTDSAGTRLVKVALSKHTTIPFPVEMRLKLADGSTQEVRLPVDVWARGDRFEATVAVRANVVGARLWPVPSVPDFEAANDTWGDAPAADPLGPVTAGGLATPIPSATAAALGPGDRGRGRGRRTPAASRAPPRRPFMTKTCLPRPWTRSHFRR